MTPDRWVLLRITPPEGEDFYKVLATCSGGYLSGDSWRLNSGIASVQDHRKSYAVHGESGSCYFLGKESYGVAGVSNHTILAQLIEKDGIELVPEAEALELLLEMGREG